MKPLKLSIIIPTLNEASHIFLTLKNLQHIRNKGHEIILCDGGSTDNTTIISRSLVDRCTQSAPGRAMQMNAGANIATGDVLCFLHADTVCPKHIDQLILNSLVHSENRWGFFNIKLSGTFWVFRVIEWFINKRSFISNVASGDQGIFLYHDTFTMLRGFSDIALMEDIEISKRLKKISAASIVNLHPLVTSSRRWEKHGIIHTVLLMWQLRLRYFLGASPDTLLKKYKPHASKK